VAYLRKLPSGKWQATVRGPDGTRHTETDPLKSAVKKVIESWNRRRDVCRDASMTHEQKEARPS